MTNISWHRNKDIKGTGIMNDVKCNNSKRYQVINCASGQTLEELGIP